MVKTDNPKKVLVVGGRMAGMEAATVLKKRGHNAILAQASDTLGRQFLLTGKAPRKAEMHDAAVSFGKQTIKVGVDIHLSTPVPPKLIEELKPESL